MNKIITTIILGVLFSSCAHHKYGVLYSADTTKKGKCDPVPYTEATIEAIFNKVSSNEMKQYEEQSGYSECTVSYPDKDSILSECKKPISYKGYLSKKRAGCDKFMSDNKLL